MADCKQIIQGSESKDFKPGFIARVAIKLAKKYCGGESGGCGFGAASDTPEKL